MNMKSTLPTAFKRLLAVSAMAMIGTAALAQADAPPPPAPHERVHQAQRGEGPGRPDPRQFAEHMQRRQAELKTKLAITPQQEGAWSSWTQALKPQKDVQRPDPRAEREALAKLTTPERIDRMRALKAQRDMQATQRGEATKAFYAALSPEQQKVFDDQTLRMGPHGGPGGPRPGPVSYTHLTLPTKA